MNAAELLELGKKPIRAEAPAGEAARDTPEFERLQAEVRKLEHPDQPTPDWEGAVEAGRTLLDQRGKDLLVAAYFSVALYERNGCPGLLAGLTIVRDLVTQYWAELHPDLSRLRARSTAIEWLGERGAQRVRRRPPPTGEAEAARTCLERIEEIGAALEGKLDSGPALLSELRDALRESASEPEPASASSGARPAAPTAPSAPAAITSAAELEAALSEARRLLRMIAEHVRQSDPQQPMPYRASRFAAWMTVRQAPPHAAQKTQIPPPQPADLPQRLEQMVSNQQWAGVLQEAEGRIASSMFWLDLHRYVVLALEGQGEPYRAAAQAVRDEVLDLLDRVPELAELRFANDQPLANAETRAWIESLRKGTASEPAAPPPAALEGGEEREAAFAEARALVGARKLPEALGLLERGAARAGGLREWVAWKLEIARTCLREGHVETALAQLEGVDERLRRSSIEDWDPATCVEVLRNLLLCRQRLPGAARSPEEGRKSRELLDRLTRLDVVAAVELNGRK